mmetsp:Transcript_16064/g.27364  ORF Transcript_16064/g.27364 Transcript_16064/m.27364 type:complete len:113 (-) Transcript_16064:715-1053(-)
MLFFGRRLLRQPNKEFNFPVVPVDGAAVHASLCRFQSGTVVDWILHFVHSMGAVSNILFARSSRTPTRIGFTKALSRCRSKESGDTKKRGVVNEITCLRVRRQGESMSEEMM